MVMSSTSGSIVGSTITVQCIEFSTTSLAFIDLQGVITSTFVRTDSVAIWESQTLVAFINIANVASSANSVRMLYTYIHVPVIVHSAPGAVGVNGGIAADCSYISQYPMSSGFFESALVSLVTGLPLPQCPKQFIPTCWSTKTSSLSLSVSKYRRTESVSPTVTMTTSVVYADSTTMRRTGTLTLSSGQNYMCGGFSYGTYGYFFSYTSPGGLYKFNPSTMAYVGAAYGAVGEDYFMCGAVYGSNGYFATDTIPGNIVKISLTTMTRVTSASTCWGLDQLRTVQVVGQYGYFGTINYGYVLKFDLANMACVTYIQATGNSETNFIASTSYGGYYYYTTYQVPGRLCKFDFSTDSYVGSIAGAAGENYFVSIGMSGSNTYVGCFTAPGRLVKFDLSTFTRLAVIYGGSTGEDYFMSVLSSGIFVYVTTANNPSRLIRVNTKYDIIARRTSGAQDEVNFRSGFVYNGMFYYGTGEATPTAGVIARYNVGVTLTPSTSPSISLQQMSTSGSISMLPTTSPSESQQGGTLSVSDSLSRQRSISTSASPSLSQQMTASGSLSRTPSTSLSGSRQARTQSASHSPSRSGSPSASVSPSLSKTPSTSLSGSRQVRTQTVSHSGSTSISSTSRVTVSDTQSGSPTKTNPSPTTTQFLSPSLSSSAFPSISDTPTHSGSLPSRSTSSTISLSKSQQVRSMSKSVSPSDTLTYSPSVSHSITSSLTPSHSNSRSFSPKSLSHKMSSTYTPSRSSSITTRSASPTTASAEDTNSVSKPSMHLSATTMQSSTNTTSSTVSASATAYSPSRLSPTISTSETAAVSAVHRSMSISDSVSAILASSSNSKTLTNRSGSATSTLDIPLTATCRTMCPPVVWLRSSCCNTTVDLSENHCNQSLRLSNTTTVCSRTCPSNASSTHVVVVEADKAALVESMCYERLLVVGCSSATLHTQHCDDVPFMRINASALQLLRSSGPLFSPLSSAMFVVSPGVLRVLFSTGVERSIVVTVDDNVTAMTTATSQPVSLLLPTCAPLSIVSVRGCSLNVFPGTAECSVNGGDVLVIELRGDTASIVALPIKTLSVAVVFLSSSNATYPCVGLSWVSNSGANSSLSWLQCILTNGTGTGGEVQLLLNDGDVVIASQAFAVSYRTAGGGTVLSLACKTSGDAAVCSGHGWCDSSSGACVCNSNDTVGYWAGSVCDRCSAMYVNSTGCRTACPVSSRGLVCNGRGTCLEGVCSCFDGASGSICTAQCPGLLTPCSDHGICDSLSATCRCFGSASTGYYDGEDCAVCAYGWSGDNCTIACPVDPGTSLVCGGHGNCVDGLCVCDWPYCGATCASTTCPPCLSPVAFGWNCAQQCPGVVSRTDACSGHGTCDSGVNGTGLCVCNPAYGGKDCSKTCIAYSSSGGLGVVCSGHGACLRGSLCACNAGFTGPLCSSACPMDAVTGLACAGHGTCTEVTAGIAECVCDSFFGGPLCNTTCPVAVGLVCSGHGTCTMNGTCSCLASLSTGFWSGVNCSECAYQWFGLQCSMTCGRGPNGRICNDHGSCTSSGVCACHSNPVVGWWSGETCTACLPGYWGPLCTQECPGAACNRCSGNGVCNDGVNGTGVCVCYDTDASGHFAGSQCDSCRAGFYGGHCDKRCPQFSSSSGASRLPLVCGGNGICSDGFSGSGVCTCVAGFAVDATGNCVTCSAGLYGQLCNLACPVYGGAVCFGHGVCFDGLNGNGSCACTSGYFGLSCSMYCPTTATVATSTGIRTTAMCGGHGQCFTNNTCSCTGNYALDAASMLCSVCVAGFTGSACQVACPRCVFGTCNDRGNCTCTHGYWGTLCEKGCPGGVVTPCSGHGLCNSITGKCDCFSSASQGYFDGPLCAVCQGAFNSTACTTPCPVGSNGVVCSGRGSCYEGVCNNCTPLANETAVVVVCGFTCNMTNAQCFSACSFGFWGVSCTSPCPGYRTNSLTNVSSVCSDNGICVAATGQCVCRRGFFGQECELSCPVVSSNQSNASSLPCAGHGTCSIGGVCSCLRGYYGVECDHECPGGASKPCSMHGTCDSHNGRCTCDGTSFGAACERECPGGRNNTCSFSGTCTAVGSCTCFSDSRRGFYYGEICQDCAQGWSGPLCTETCIIGQGISFNRQCVCTTGFVGAACAVRCPMGDNGQVCSAQGVCALSPSSSSTTSMCVCDDNYYGPACQSYCLASECDRSLIHVQCNPNHGTCECLDTDARGHFTGSACDDCVDGYWGAECNVPCPCNHHGTCNRFTGSCRCFYNAQNGFWRGTHCSYCASSYIGDTCDQRNVELSVAAGASSIVTSSSSSSYVGGGISAGPSLTFIDEAANIALTSGTSVIAVYHLSPRLVSIGTIALSFGYEFAGAQLLDDDLNHTLMVVHSVDSPRLVSVRIPRGVWNASLLLDVASMINAAILLETEHETGRGIASNSKPAVVVGSRMILDDGRRWRAQSSSLTTAVASTLPCTATCGQGTSSVSISCSGVSHQVDVQLGTVSIQFLSWFGSLLVVGGSETTFGSWAVSVINVSFYGGTVFVADTYSGVNSGSSDAVVGVTKACALEASLLTCGVELSTTATTAVVLIDLNRSQVVASKTLTTVNAPFVTAVAIDGDSSCIIAVNAPYAPSYLERFLLPSLQHISEYTIPIVGADVFTVTAISVNSSKRLAFVSLSSANTVGMYAMNLFGIASVEPDVLDSSGGTPVTVTGYGFMLSTSDVSCVFGGNATHLGIATPALVVSSTVLTCIAPRSEESSDMCTGTPINVRFTNRTSNTTLISARRPVTAQPIAAITADGTSGYGSSTVSSMVTLSGHGFTASSYARCRLRSRESSQIYFVATVTVLNTTHVTFVQPIAAATDVSAWLQYSHDGTFFSALGAPFVLTGEYHNISLSAATPQLRVAAAHVSPLPLFNVYSQDRNGNRLLKTDNTTRSIYCGTLKPLELLIGLPEKVSWDQNSDTLHIMRDGVAVVAMTMVLPQATQWTLYCSDKAVSASVSSIEVVVTAGKPAQVVVATPVSSWHVGVLAPLPLSPSPVIVITDVAGNTVRNSSSLPPYVRVEYLNMIPDPFSGQAVASNQSDIAYPDAAGSFLFLAPVVRSMFGGTLTLQFSAAGVLPASVMVPVMTCIPGSEYGLTGTFRCLSCPPFGICDGTSVVRVRPSYWRATQQSLVFYSCTPPEACPGGYDCNVGYESTLCSRCSDGYGRSQRGCDVCNAKWLNILGVVGIIAAQSAQVYFMAVRGAPFTAVEDLRLFPEATMRVSLTSMAIKFATSHFQILGIIPFADMALPEWLNVFFESSRAASSFNPNFSFLTCLFGEGAFRKLYVSVLYVPLLIGTFSIGALWFAAMHHNKYVRRALVKFGHGELQEVLAAARSCVDRDKSIVDIKQTIMYAQFLHPNQSNEHLTDYYNELLAWDEHDKIKPSAPPSRWKRWANVLMLSTLGVLFLMYPSIIMNGVAALQCRSIDLGHGATQSVLVADPAVDCRSESYQQEVPFAWLLLMAFGLGVPAAVVFLVQLARHTTLDGDMDIARRMFYFATGGYDPRHWFYEGLMLLLKAAIVVAGALIPRSLVRLVAISWILVVYIVVMHLWPPWEALWLAQLQTLSLGTIALTVAFLSFFTFDEVVKSVPLSQFVVAGIVVVNAILVIVSVFTMWWNTMRIKENATQRHQSGAEVEGGSKDLEHENELLEKQCQRAFNLLSRHSVRLTYLLDRVLFDVHRCLRHQFQNYSSSVQRIRARQQQQASAASEEVHRNNNNKSVITTHVTTERNHNHSKTRSFSNENASIFHSPKHEEEEEEESATNVWNPARRSVQRPKQPQQRGRRIRTVGDDEEHNYALGMSLPPLMDMLQHSTTDPAVEMDRLVSGPLFERTTRSESPLRNTNIDALRRGLAYQVQDFTTSEAEQHLQDNIEDEEVAFPSVKKRTLDRKRSSNNASVSWRTKDFQELLVEDLEGSDNDRTIMEHCMNTDDDNAAGGKVSTLLPTQVPSLLSATAPASLSVAPQLQDDMNSIARVTVPPAPLQHMHSTSPYRRIESLGGPAISVNDDDSALVSDLVQQSIDCAVGALHPPRGQELRRDVHDEDNWLAVEVDTTALDQEADFPSSHYHESPRLPLSPPPNADDSAHHPLVMNDDIIYEYPIGDDHQLSALEIVANPCVASAEHFFCDDIELDDVDSQHKEDDAVHTTHQWHSYEVEEVEREEAADVFRLGGHLLLDDAAEQEPSLDESLQDVIGAARTLLHQQVLAAAFITTRKPSSSSSSSFLTFFSPSSMTKEMEELEHIVEQLQVAEAAVIHTYRCVLSHLLEPSTDNRGHALKKRILRRLCAQLDDLISDRNHFTRM